MSQRIQLEIDEGTLYRLLKTQLLCLNDFRCLDPSSQRFVRHSFLKALKQRLDDDGELL